MFLNSRSRMDLRMSQTPTAVRVAREYNLGLIWATSVFLMCLVIMAWYAGSLVSVVGTKLAVFLLWLHVVPLCAVSRHRIFA